MSRIRAALRPESSFRRRLVAGGTISPTDIDLISVTDSPDEAREILRTGIDASAARQLPGVSLVLTADDVADLGGLPCLFNLETDPFTAPPYPILAKDVKRLHDMGQSGWWAAIPFGVGLIGGIAVFVQIGMAAMNNMAAFEREDPEVIFALIGPAMASSP